jgi:hypothetical protein
MDVVGISQRMVQNLSATMITSILIQILTAVSHLTYFSEEKNVIHQHVSRACGPRV